MKFCSLFSSFDTVTRTFLGPGDAPSYFCNIVSNVHSDTACSEDYSLVMELCSSMVQENYTDLVLLINQRK